MVLIGATTPETAGRIAALYDGIDAPVVTTTIRTAEAVKYASNAFHALKVCFANEMAEIAARGGADPRETMRIFAMDRKLNISDAYLRPGFAFGGPCLVKDVEALVWDAGSRAIDAPLLAAIQPSNTRQIRRSVEAVLSTGKRRVGLIGLGFKPDARDLRGSPVTAFARALVDAGCDLRVFEPLCRPEALAAELAVLTDRFCGDLGSLLTHADVLVIGPGVAVADAQRVRSVAADRVVVDLTTPWLSARVPTPSSFEPSAAGRPRATG